MGGQFFCDLPLIVIRSNKYNSSSSSGSSSSSVINSKSLKMKAFPNKHFFLENHIRKIEEFFSACYIFLCHSFQGITLLSPFLAWSYVTTCKLQTMQTKYGIYGKIWFSSRPGAQIMKKESLVKFYHHWFEIENLLGNYRPRSSKV